MNQNNHSDDDEMEMARDLPRLVLSPILLDHTPADLEVGQFPLAMEAIALDHPGERAEEEEEGAAPPPPPPPPTPQQRRNQSRKKPSPASSSSSSSSSSYGPIRSVVVNQVTEPVVATIVQSKFKAVDCSICFNEAIRPQQCIRCLNVICTSCVCHLDHKKCPSCRTSELDGTEFKHSHVIAKINAEALGEAIYEQRVLKQQIDLLGTFIKGSEVKIYAHPDKKSHYLGLNWVVAHMEAVIEAARNDLSIQPPHNKFNHDNPHELAVHLHQMVKKAHPQFNGLIKVTTSTTMWHVDPENPNHFVPNEITVEFFLKAQHRYINLYLKTGN